MLKELLGERIHFEKEAKDWKEALQLSFQSLLKDQCIEPRYIYSIINNVEELGPYLILHDSIALPHAHPQDGVRRPAMSFLRLENGVHFPDTAAPVYMFFSMAVTDEDDHHLTLITLAEMMENKKIRENLLAASTKEQVMALLSEYQSKNSCQYDLK